MDAKSWYWAPHPIDGYIPVRLKHTQQGLIARIPDTGEQFAVTEDQLLPAHESSLQPCDNLVTMQELTEPALLHNLRVRFLQDMIYTWISSILIAVNPFKQLPLYSAHVMAQYRQGLAQHQSLPPHVFTVSDNAFKSMLRGASTETTEPGISQVAVIIAGESGSGKTETSRAVLNYLTEIASQSSQNNSSSSSSNNSGNGNTAPSTTAASISDRILSTNPLLEGFGNAKTVRNNNSSRFGKFIRLCFNGQAEIVGASIESYLLEKSRIVQQGPGERNYHIFYQLFSGLDQQTLKAWQLSHPAEFTLTAGSSLSGGSQMKVSEALGHYVVDGIDDKDDFYSTQKAFEQIGIDSTLQRIIFQVIAGCLHLGNVEFEAKSSDASALQSQSLPSLRQACVLLGVNEDALIKAFTSQKKQMGRDFVTTNKSQFAAIASLFACIKALYAQQFDWLIAQMNKTLAPQQHCKRFIGILDIFGFEIFEINSFEQLCINFTNEKMQRHFNQHIFQLEIEEYKQERLDIDTSEISYIDNQPCLDVIETGRICILSLCDEELRTPKGTDESLLTKMHSQLSKNQFYEKPKLKSNVFTIAHYAGPVTYTIDGFLDKNKDRLDTDIAIVFSQSSIPHVAQLMAPLVDNSQQANNSTLGHKFKSQLHHLMSVLNASEPYFIRCIKSNSLKIGDTFDGTMVLSQLRYLGLREVVKIRQRGFPIRSAFSTFLARYKLLLPPIYDALGQGNVLSSLLSNINKNAQTLITTLLHAIDPSDKDWKMGQTKIFYRLSIQSLLEARRESALASVVLEVQTHIRCLLERHRFVQQQKLLTTLRQLVSAATTTTTNNKHQQLSSSSFDTVIDQCERCGISPVAKTEIAQLYQTCIRLRHELHEQEEINISLTNATQNKDLELLLTAIIALRDLYTQITKKRLPILGSTPQSFQIEKLDPNEIPTTFHSTFSQAVELAKKLQRITLLSSEVSQTRDIDSLQELILLTKQVEMPMSTIQRWERMYLQIKEEDHVQRIISTKNTALEQTTMRKLLQLAVDKRSTLLIHVLIPRAKRLGFVQEDMYQQASRLQIQLPALTALNQSQIIAELQFALDSEDYEIIQEAIALARRKNLAQHALTQQSETRCATMKQELDLRDALKLALKAPQLSVLTTAIENAASSSFSQRIMQTEEYRQAIVIQKELQQKQKTFGHRASIHARRSIAATSKSGKMGGLKHSDDAPTEMVIVEGDEDFDPDALIDQARAAQNIDFANLPPGLDIWATATIDELEIALSEAESAGLPPQEVAKIKSQLARLQQQKHVTSLLKNAIAAKNLKLLESAIQRAERAGLTQTSDGSGLFDEALKMCQFLRERKALRGAAAAAANAAVLENSDESEALHNPLAALQMLQRTQDIRETNIDNYLAPLHASRWFLSDMYLLPTFPWLRPVADFCKTQTYSEQDKLRMCKHQTKDIVTTLLIIETFDEVHLTYATNALDEALSQSSHPGSGAAAQSKKIADFVSHATSLFKSIQAYMYDRKLSFPESLIAELILTCQAYPGFRDEVYAQVMKQCSGNMSGPSLLRGWRLLSILARHIAPSPRFFPYVLRFLFTHTPESPLDTRAEFPPSLTADDRVILQNISRYCLTLLPLTFRESILVAGDLARRHMSHTDFYLPAKTSVANTTGQATTSDSSSFMSRYDHDRVQELIKIITQFGTKSMLPVLMHVYFPDTSAVAIPVAPWDNPTQIVERACARVGITDTQGLWLYENYKAENFALLPYENPIDVQLSWLDKSQKKRKLFAGAASNDPNAVSSVSQPAAKQSAFSFSRFRRFINNSLSVISEPNTVVGPYGLIINKSGKRKMVIRRRLFLPPLQLSYDNLSNLLLFYQTVHDVSLGLHYLHAESAAMIVKMSTLLLPRQISLAAHAKQHVPVVVAAVSPYLSNPEDDDDEAPPPPPPPPAFDDEDGSAAAPTAPPLSPRSKPRPVHESPEPALPQNITKVLLPSGSVDIDFNIPTEPPIVDIVKVFGTPTCPPNLLLGRNKLTSQHFLRTVESTRLDLSLLSVEQYVATVMQVPTFAASYFWLTQQFDPALPRECILSVNSQGIFILNAETRASLEQYSLMQVLGWSSGPLRVTLHVKLTKPDRQGKTTRALRFETSRATTGQEICHLLMAYAKDMLDKFNAKAAAAAGN